MSAYNLSPFYQTSQFTSNGTLLVGGQLFWYVAGTTTPVTVYQDSAGVTPFSNPIILDARGEPAAPVWLQAGAAYKAILKDASGVQLQVIDNITGIGDTYNTSVSFPSIQINSTGNASLLFQSASGNLAVQSNYNGGTPYYFTFNNTGEFAASEIQATNGLLLHKNSIGTSYALPAGYNAISAGPVSVLSGVTVTVPSGSTWSLV